MTFIGLLKLQSDLEIIIESERNNGFTPRKRDTKDIILGLDDELQEWLKEVPEALNFKNWKEKEYSYDDEVKEFADILFFILQLFNKFNMTPVNDLLELWRRQDAVLYQEVDYLKKEDKYKLIMELVFQLKKTLYAPINDRFKYLMEILRLYMLIAEYRGFSCELIVSTYLSNWRNNTGRIDGDWSLKGENNGIKNLK
ncbi:hypothetical protein IX317_000619 [Fusobacterium sp. DD29]|uniref:dUTP diphosphatase n=1 Tax=unclassified Fusobacterium TaxID=2648384 RepID=UPI001B8D61D2|nr:MULTISPECIES: dUTP diphosphatase [unclassified Fusobacterium]MBR8700259.1 hypothetical protein [Fusobacterium sp. DD45]MBR8710486.1 hypothetical protein [Fusobacterium sp. DD28]MBR8748958.1 hypothetical protein [Fusobacterium sp. DD29]MBR8751064.1 hypothetical protein [Fusobacterium sp. DD26]MBR8761264.1 hypothetical protein [Fusobacterium sp. DD25]